MITGIIDLHVHSAPSLLPRRHSDNEMIRVARQAGVSTLVLKAHEGSTAERAILAGPGVVGGIALNSPVGGANPDAVRVAAALGGRVVWLPTISAPAHIAANSAAELSVHRNTAFAKVLVCDEGRLRPEWYPVLEIVAAHDLVLASGHLTMDETLCVFREAAARGVKRLLVNHPLFGFLGWRDEHIEAFTQLEARIEIGVLADHLTATDSVKDAGHSVLSGAARPSTSPPGGSAQGARCKVEGRKGTPTEYFASRYPSRLIVFGSDLGHTSFPEYIESVRAWIERFTPVFGEARLVDILTKNGRELLSA